MPDITIPNTLSDGNTILASELNQNFTAVTDVVNGNIDNDNIAAGAAIAASKLAIANILTAASTISIGVGTTGDTNPRIALDTDGHLVLGSGSAAGDVRLTRESAGVAAIRNAANSAYEDLKVDNLTTATPLANASGGLGFAPSLSGKANYVVAVNSGETALELQQASAGSMFKPAMITETLRTFPTSGSVSGIYVMKDVAWTSTGAITLAGPTFVYANGGSFTLNHTITGTPLPNGGKPTTTTAATSYVPGGNGGGLGGGQSASYTADGGGGGGGSPASADGGNGGAANVYNQGMGGTGYSYLDSLTGSGGGSNTCYSSGADAGLPGGGGGTCFVLETYNCNVDLNESISCKGGDGADQTFATYNAGPGGGGGGSVIITLGGTGTFDLAAAKSINVSGGDGGNGYSTNGGGGGGGGGGYIQITTESATLAVNGTLTVSGGAAGSGSATKAAAAGSAGSSSTASSTAPISVR